MKELTQAITATQSQTTVSSGSELLSPIHCMEETFCSQLVLESGFTNYLWKNTAVAFDKASFSIPRSPVKIATF